MFKSAGEYGEYLAFVRKYKGDLAYAKEIRRLCVTDLVFLCFVLGFGDVNTDLHRSMIGFLKKLSSGYRKALMLVARGHLKSSILTVAWSIQQVLKRRGRIRIGITSHSVDGVIEFSNQIKYICENNEVLRKIFPDIFWSNMEGITPWRGDAFKLKGQPANMKEATFEAFPIIEQPIGRHYDIIIADDIVTRENTKSARSIDEVNECFGLLFSLLEPGGIFVVTGTNYHYHDQYEKISSGTLGEGWITYRQSAYDENDNPVFKERFTITESQANELRELYKSCGIKNPVVTSLQELEKIQGSYVHSCQYRLDPVKPDEKVFHIDDIIIDDWDEERCEGTECILAVDPAKTTKNHSAFTAMWVLRKDHKGNMLAEEAINAKMPTEEIVDMIFNLVRTWNISTVMVEKTGWEDLERIIEERMIDDDTFFYLEAKGAGSESKEDRVRRTLEYPIKRGKLFFRKTLSNTIAFKTFRNALIDFPFCRNWDQLDALVHAVKLDVSAFDAQLRKKEPIVPGTAGEILDRIWRRSNAYRSANRIY